MTHSLVAALIVRISYTIRTPTNECDFRLLIVPTDSIYPLAAATPATTPATTPRVGGSQATPPSRVSNIDHDDGPVDINMAIYSLVKGMSVRMTSLETRLADVEVAISRDREVDGRRSSHTRRRNAGELLGGDTSSPASGAASVSEEIFPTSVAVDILGQIGMGHNRLRVSYCICYTM